MQTAQHQKRRSLTWWPETGLVAAAINLVLCWQERASQRRHLGRLDDRALKDIGLSRADAAGEMRRPFWRG